MPVPRCLLGAAGVPSVYPAPLLVRNTFIEVAERPPYFEVLPGQRRTRSCPADPARASSDPSEGGTECSIWESSALETRGSRSHANSAEETSECSTTDTPLEQAPKAPIVTAPGSWRRTGFGNAPVDAWGDRGFRRARTWGRGFPDAEPVYAEDEGACRSALPWTPPGTFIAAQRSPMPMQGLPSLGSAGHQVGACKPCAFFNTKGCENGLECKFCHLCEVGEKKKRRKEKLQFRSSIRQMRRMNNGADGGWSRPRRAV